MPQLPKKVYLFDAMGELINSFRGAAECADHIKSQRQTVTNAVARKSLLGGKYYVGHEDTFTLPNLKQENNPFKIAARKKVRQVPTMPGQRPGRSVRSYIPSIDPQMDNYLSERYIYG